jgi:hypothetical protein
VSGEMVLHGLGWVRPTGRQDKSVAFAMGRRGDDVADSRAGTSPLQACGTCRRGRSTTYEISDMRVTPAGLQWS